MILKRNNHRQALKFALGVILLCFFFATLSIHPTSAASTKIKVKDITKVASFKSERGGIQGGTITAKYYIFADKDPGNWGKTTIRFFNRGNKKEVKANKNLIAQEFKHASTIYYKWGGAYAEIIDANTGNWWCVDVNARKRVGQSKCGSKLSSSGLNHGKIQYWRQGWTKYGDYYFRAYAGLGNNIEVYNKNRKFVKNYVVPSVGCNEIEDVSVDGSSGDVYIMCHNKTGGHYATYYKINGSVFGNYVSVSSGGSSSSEDGTPSKSAARKKTASDYQKDSYTPSVSTYDGVIDTIFFGTIQDDGEGCGVYTVLDLVMTILTIGIGVTALIGITISGITYLTAKDNVEKTTKAKRRIFEIVIGLVAYAAIWGILTFLLPEFNPELKTCTQSTQTTETTESA